MNRTEIFAYLVIPLPVEIKYGRSNNYNLHYQKLLSLPLSLKFSLSDYGLFDSHINVISQSSNEHDLIKDMYNPSTGRKELILKIALLKSVPFDDSFIRRYPFDDEVAEIKGKDAISLHKSTICERFIEQINDFIILMRVKSQKSH